jgi:hypothetical protein
MRAVHSLRLNLARACYARLRPRALVRLARIALTGLMCGCATSAPPPPTTFVPEHGAGVQTVYRHGSAYAALSNPRGPVLVTLQPVMLSDRSFVRLWLHVQNRQARAFRIDPDDIYLERRVRGSDDRTRLEPETEDVLARLEPGDRARAERGALVGKPTIPPGESLQGAVYFRSPAPELGRKAPAEAAYAYDLTLHLPTPDGPKQIVLRPVPART